MLTQTPTSSLFSFSIRFWSMVLLPGLLLLACQDSRFGDFIPEQLDPLPEQQLVAYADTLQTISRLRSLSTDRRRLDSLIYYAEWLKEYDEAAAYYYAETAYELATRRNWPFPRAISAYRLADLKERKAQFGAELEDALVDLKISKRIFEALEKETWKARTHSLLGKLFYRSEDIDSARYYLHKALDKIVETDISSLEKKKWKGRLLQHLAITFPLEDPQYQSYIEQSIEIYEALGMEEDQAWLGIDLGKMYQQQGNYPLADSLFKASLNYAEENADSELKIKALQNLGYAHALRYYDTEGKQEDHFIQAEKFFRKALDLQADNHHVTYNFLAWLHHVRWGKSGSDTAGDSTVYYNKLAIEAARNAGALGVLKRSMDITRDLLGFAQERRDSGIILSNLNAFMNENYNAILDTLRQNSRSAYQRINEIEQREILKTAEQKRRNQTLISGGIIIMLATGAFFLVIYQRQKRKDLQFLLETLRAQINPHFVSNSLNAIENLIMQDKKQEAAKHIVHFSRLSRQILNRSLHPTASLKEELAALKHFLELEKLRFKDKLDYEIKVDPELQAEVIDVPSLMLQPYIESAIWYGIKPKSSPGQLQIVLKQINEKLEVIIEDDGIGRAESKALRAKFAQQQQRSIGTKITEERLHKMRKIKGAQVKVTDLKDASVAASGTRVQIRLPIKYRK